VRTVENHNQKGNHMITTLAELTGNMASAFGLLGAAIGVGLIGQKAAEAVGRNPAASGKVLVQAIIGMALAEGLGILALFLA
jgi:F-type H+-transporting ATPase subunit c